MNNDRQNVVDMDGQQVDDDHLLSMWIDKELDSEQTSILKHRLKSEGALRDRLNLLESIDNDVRVVFGRDPIRVPNHISAMLEKPEPHRAELLRQRPNLLGFSAVASFIVVLFLGNTFFLQSDFNPMRMDTRLMTALENNLSRALGWDSIGGGRSFRAVLSFPAADGRWCREFLIAENESHWRGVACRNDGSWVTEVVGSEVFLEQAQHYRTAEAAENGKVASFIDNTATDVAITSKQESKLISNSWKKDRITAHPP